MAAFAMTDVDMYWAGLDLACYSNQVEVAVTSNDIDVTTFCSGGWTEMLSGLRSVSLKSSGPTDMTPASSSFVPSSTVWASGFATVTATGHGLTPGRTVTFSGFTPTAWNGSYRVFDTPTANTFRVQIDSNPGTVTVQGRVKMYDGLDEVIGAGGVGDIGPWSAVPMGGTEGSVAYFTDAVLMGFTPLTGSVGDVAAYEAMWSGRQRLVRGVLTSSQVVSATGNGSGFQLGSVTASQKVYAALHVLSAAGTTPSITVKIQSDDNSGFTSPTDRITFSAATVHSGQFSSLAGSITDDWWRAVWTITGTTPGFAVRTIIGIA